MQELKMTKQSKDYIDEAYDRMRDEKADEEYTQLKMEFKLIVPI